MEKPKTNIVELFDDAKLQESYLKVSAPMVRYTKLEFRNLLKHYGTDLCFTSMIMADSFCESEKARLNEFTTNLEDTPVIAQFAANNVNDFLSATEMVYPYVDGVDLNCGCPQSWAMKDGFGSAMLKTPELIADLLSTVRRNFPSNFSVSVKIRLLQKSLKSTIEMCRQLEKTGITFLTVHGRTASQKTNTPVDKEAIKEIKQSLQIPLIANGDVFNLSDADKMHEITKCDGVMSARGLLTNPALFSGHEKTPLECIERWISICNRADTNITFQCLHHHLMFMLEKTMKKPLRIQLSKVSNKEEIFEFLKENLNIEPQCIDDFSEKFHCTYNDEKHKNRTIPKSLNMYNSDNSEGKFFGDQLEKLQNNAEDSLDFMDSNMFDE